MAVRAGIELIKLYGMQETRPDPNRFQELGMNQVCITIVGSARSYV
jgi:hypothetical protein